MFLRSRITFEECGFSFSLYFFLLLQVLQGKFQ
ncbi:MAG: hypothetical protein ACI93E_001301, partial [Flavobacteriales bacterium]